MAVVITPADVTNVAPEFATESSPRIQTFIDFANLFVCEAKYGNKTKMALIYYTAHLLKMSELAESGANGPITSERVGELSVNYASSSDTENSELGMTTYGQMVKMIKRGLVSTPILVG